MSDLGKFRSVVDYVRDYSEEYDLDDKFTFNHYEKCCHYWNIYKLRHTFKIDGLFGNQIKRQREELRKVEKETAEILREY